MWKEGERSRERGREREKRERERGGRTESEVRESEMAESEWTGACLVAPMCKWAGALCHDKEGGEVSSSGQWIP